MGERSKRNRRRDEDRERRETSEGRYGRDEPWREERRVRQPEASSGGERRQLAEDRWRSDGAAYRGDFGREEHGDYGEDRGRGWGQGYGYGFSDGGEYQGPRSRGGWDSHPRQEAREWEARRFEDTDWASNRPARGRETWGGDWTMERGSRADWSRTGRMGDWMNRGPVPDYSGRGPKDYRRSDDRIREEVCDIFTDDPNLDPSDVVVNVDSGDVTLMGTVSSREQKRRAEQLAERVSGVGDVINQLRVARGEAPSAPASTGRATRGGAAPPPPGVAADRENR